MCQCIGRQMFCSSSLCLHRWILEYCPAVMSQIHSTHRTCLCTFSSRWFNSQTMSSNLEIFVLVLESFMMITQSEFFMRSKNSGSEFTGVSKKALNALPLLSSEPKYQSSNSSFSRAPEEVLLHAPSI